MRQLTNQQNLNQTLQAQIDNHACSALPDHTCPTLTSHTDSPCSLIHLPEPHVCSIQTNNCSHSEESQITQKINEELNLGLANPNLKQVISKLKELIHKPPTIVYQEDFEENQEQLNQTQQTVLHLEKQLQEKNTPFGENLETIKQLELTSLQELFKQAVDAATIQQIQQATNYKAVVAARQAFLQKQLGQKESAVQIVPTKNELIVQPNKERVVLISLLVGSLVSVGGLLIKLKGIKISNK